MALRPRARPLERDFLTIHEQEFEPIDVDRLCSGINLYSGAEEMREFDLAMRLHLVRAGDTIHQKISATTPAAAHWTPRRR